METDEPDVAATPDTPESNVVRFPRDWLGPLDELVPFGPSAGQRSDAEPDDSGVVEFKAPTPLRAEDFWGEASAAIHDALEAPAAAAENAVERDASRRRPRLRRRETDPRRLRLSFARSSRSNRISSRTPYRAAAPEDSCS